MCSVPKCSRDVFLTQDRMKYHWKEKHTLFLEYFHCKLCGKRLPQRRQLSKHLYLDHFFPYQTAQKISQRIRPQRVANHKYVNPGRQVCPRFRPQDHRKGKSSSDKSTNKVRVEKEAKQSYDAKEKNSVSQSAIETGVFGEVLPDSSAEQPTLIEKVQMESKPLVSPKVIEDMIEKEKHYVKGRVESTKEDVKIVVLSDSSDIPKIVAEDEDLISDYIEDSLNIDMSEFICIDEIGDEDAEANEESPEKAECKGDGTLR